MWIASRNLRNVSCFAPLEHVNAFSQAGGGVGVQHDVAAFGVVLSSSHARKRLTRQHVNQLYLWATYRKTPHGAVGNGYFHGQ